MSSEKGDKMSKRPPHQQKFKAEARERLTSLETRQETLQDKADQLKDGQYEILDRIDERLDGVASDDDLQEIEETLDSVEATARENQRARAKAKFLAKLSGAALTAIGSGAALLSVI